MRILHRFEVGADVLVLGGLIFAGAIAWLVWMGGPTFPLDDAYIVQHAVEGVKAGTESRFVGASPMDGATSPLHVLVITLASFLMPVVWAQALVALSAAALYLAGAYVLARRAGLSLAWSAAMTVLALTSGLTLTHLLNGLETALAMAGLIWSFSLFWTPRPHQPRAWMLLGLLPFIRPELGLWSLLLGVRALLAAPAPDETGARVRVIREAAIWGAAAVVPMMLAVLALGGALLPNTIGAKEAFFAEGCLPVLDRVLLVRQILVGGAPYVAIALAAPLLVIASRFRWFALAFIAVFLAVYTLKLPGAFHHNEFRYLHLLIPFALLGVVELLRPRLPTDGQTQDRVGPVVALVLLAVAAAGLPGSWARYENGIAKTRGELQDVAVWAAENLPSDAVVMVHDAGVISRFGDQKLIDLVGLKSRSSAATHQATTFATCSRDPQAMDQIARNSGATHFIVLADWDRIFEMTQGLRTTGWSLTRLDTARGASAYEVYALAPPAA